MVNYWTNMNARINILSITAGCNEYIYSSQFIGDGVTTFPKTPSRLGRDENWAVDSQENH